jgi:glycosyltransferase involved in cell wall biosynthesis
MATTTIPAPARDQGRDASRSSERSGSRRLKVCHLSMTLQTGGLERLLVDFARFHDPERFEVCFIALDALGPPADEIRDLGFEVSSVDLPNVGKYHGFRNLCKLLSAAKADILHTHNSYPSFYGSLAARFSHVPVVVNTQHGRGCGPSLGAQAGEQTGRSDVGWKSLWQFRIANQLTDRVVGVSEDATRICRGQDLPRAWKMQCIWNGIDLNRFRFSGPADEPSAISVGRLSPEKDYATLLRAVPRVVEQVPGFRLKLVGDGSERPALEALAGELGIEDHVQFLGEQKDVPDLLRTAGFFIASSKTEGISLTLLEAMAVGLPIVTTHVGGNPEVVVEGETGRLVPPGDPPALAGGILRMLEDRDRWPEMARSARERVEEHFNVRTMIRQYETLYDEVYAQKTGKPAGPCPS